MHDRLPPPARRWAISFADLALLIACTLMLGWRPAAVDGVDDDRTALLVEMSVAGMFLPGEAMLSARGAAALAPARAAVARGGRVTITVGVGTTGSRRLDAWELGAARTAVIARSLGGERVVLAAPAEGAHVQIASVR